MSYPTEEYLTLRQAIAELPGRPHLSTLIRWYLVGVRGVKLQTVLCGGRRFVSRRALQVFVEQLSQRTADGPISDSNREARIDAAERVLHD